MKKTARIPQAPGFEKDLQIIKRILSAERRMRVFIFKSQPQKQESKTREIDKGLEALKRIEVAWNNLLLIFSRIKPYET